MTSIRDNDGESRMMGLGDGVDSRLKTIDPAGGEVMGFVESTTGRGIERFRPLTGDRAEESGPEARTRIKTIAAGTTSETPESIAATETERSVVTRTLSGRRSHKTPKLKPSIYANYLWT